jgi:antitoxin MazE
MISALPYTQGRSIYERIMRVAKWGNSLALRLPKRLVEEMGLSAGDEVDVVRAEDRTLSIEKDRRRERALERLAAMRVTLPKDYKFDREEANER